MCATCHTLYTNALGPDGRVIGRLPEQVPYLEWRHSVFPAEQQTCQTCHMPVVREDTPISSVLGTPRAGVARHVFRGGNFFMLRMLNRYRAELGVSALPHGLEAAARATMGQLEGETAIVTVERAVASADRLDIDVLVRNLAGHKLPTGYPSRRVWIELVVRDADRIVFESGTITATGRINGNDNDASPLRHEPHYLEITRPDQVQVYESVMVDSEGAPTTGLLKGVRYVKDNRLLPRGFDKATVHADAAVHGEASGDRDFAGGTDRLRYAVPINGRTGPFTIDVALRFQPIGFRWAENLRPVDAAETRRFVSFYDSMAASSSLVLAGAKFTVVRP